MSFLWGVEVRFSERTSTPSRNFTPRILGEPFESPMLLGRHREPGYR
jgi:hypothetical protein